jgi:hypothetical protein
MSETSTAQYGLVTRNISGLRRAEAVNAERGRWKTVATSGSDTVSEEREREGNGSSKDLISTP